MRRLSTSFLLLLVAALLAGCVRMPTQGPVVRVDPMVTDPDDSAAFYDPLPPTPGADPEEIVLGFLEAMKATPLRTNVAAAFLSERAQRGWRPEDATLTYADHEPPAGMTGVVIRFTGANAYDKRGRWLREVGQSRSTVTFPMILEDEEWRIDGAPNALLVPQVWFEEWFERASLYYLDPTGTVTVPEPVAVPSGDQMATALVRGLLAGPPRPAVSRSSLPAGLRLALNSVPIEDGVADVVLDGPFDEIVSSDTVAQLAWTLRQVPQVTHFRLTVDDRPVTLPGGDQEISVQAGQRYSPLGGATPERDLFALVEGRLARGGFGSFGATAGAWAEDPPPVRDLGVSLDGGTAVGISPDGTKAYRGPVNDDSEVETVLQGATDLLTPSLDFAGRTWLLDRASGGARVLLLRPGGKVEELQVPGVSGRDVSHMVVSRDSSRLVAVVRGASRDRVVVSRIAHRADGGPPTFVRARQIEPGIAPARRVVDIGWRTPVTLAVLTNVSSEVAQVRLLAVDGSPGDVEGPAGTRIAGRATRLVVSPAEGDGVYVETEGKTVDLTRPSRELPGLGGEMTWFGFVG